MLRAMRPVRFWFTCLALVACLSVVLLAQEKAEEPPAWVQKAMDELRANPKYSHPYFWAPFVLVGDYR